MPRNISLRDLIRGFRKLGFNGPFPGSRHSFMAKRNLKVRIPNPHRGDISPYLLAEILRQAGISRGEWLRIQG